MKRAVLNVDTGELMTELNDGDRIVRKESIDLLRRRNKDSQAFIKGNTAEMRKLAPLLSVNERAMLFSLMPYTAYQSCVIQYSNGKDIGLKDIVKISGMCRNTATETINKLLAKDIIYKGKNSASNQYFINPWIVYRGAEFNTVLAEMFKNYRVLSHGGVRWKDLQ